MNIEQLQQFLKIINANNNSSIVNPATVTNPPQQQQPTDLISMLSNFVPNVPRNVDLEQFNINNRSNDQQFDYRNIANNPQSDYRPNNKYAKGNDNNAPFTPYQRNHRATNNHLDQIETRLTTIDGRILNIEIVQRDNINSGKDSCDKLNNLESKFDALVLKINEIDSKIDQILNKLNEN